MRQGEAPSTAAWKGNPLGGVTAPEPIVMPDPNTRFTRTATRLEALSGGHPLAEWLRFMARLAEAQHVAVTSAGRMPGLDPTELTRAVDGGMPPLAADGHRRDPAWRDGLTRLLDALAGQTIPAAARAVIADLRERDVEALESLADDFLRGTVKAGDVGAALYVAAALQVYLTTAAATLRAEDLRLLPQRGLCPCCGSTPIAGVITGSGRAPGARYLNCSLCGTAWNHVRAVCITCGETRTLSLKTPEGDSGLVKAETCDNCGTYAKMVYQAQDMAADPVADDLATFGLDLMVAEAGWARHAPNPLVLLPSG